MDLIRRLIAGSLALTLLATSGAMAVARGQSDVGSLMVICTGQAYTVMEIGADGTPVERTHLCPDCALSLIVSVEAPSVSPAATILTSVLTATAVLPSDARNIVLRNPARGPPILA